jgi:hypothetical protein
VSAGIGRAIGSANRGCAVRKRREIDIKVFGVNFMFARVIQGIWRLAQSDALASKIYCRNEDA